MNALRLINTILILLVCTTAMAQQENVCSHLKQSLYVTQAKNTIASPQENDYDVKFVKLDISLSNENVSISGYVQTLAMIVAEQSDTYVFELDTLLSIDSVLIDDIKVNVQSQKGIHFATMPQILMRGNYFTAQVYYHGTPKTGNGFFDRGGMNNSVTDQWGARITYTLSEPYMSKDWWPCKQSLQDKIDSAAIWITVPDSLKAGSNGLLKKVTPMPGNKLRYEWHTKYPIAYYLISACVGRYIDYKYKIAIPNLSDSILLQHYVYDRNGAFDFYKNGLDSTAPMLQYFSELFGSYPFYKEKYGHCLAPLSGGMEHQTMSTNGNAGPRLVAHELAHQWFGNWVTCATWKDIWINEGFASYTEYLFLEKFRGKVAARTLMDSVHAQLLPPRTAAGSIYVDDTTNIWRIFDGRLSYNKPSAVLHTLRYVINNDSLFFTVLKTFLQQHAHATATTEDFIQTTQLLTKIDLSTFFTQWIYKEGLPIYSTEWVQVQDKVLVRLLQQTTHPQSVACYKTPIDIRLQYDGGDTTIRVENDKNLQDYIFTSKHKVKAVVLDPNNYILNINRGVFINTGLAINNVTSNEVLVIPNPTADRWVIAGTDINADWHITDNTGRVVRSGNTGGNKGMIIETGGLSSGVYLLHVINKEKTTVKLIKQ